MNNDAKHVAGNLFLMMAVKWGIIIGVTHALRKAAQQMENKP